SALGPERTSPSPRKNRNSSPSHLPKMNTANNAATPLTLYPQGDHEQSHIIRSLIHSITLDIRHGLCPQSRLLLMRHRRRSPILLSCPLWAGLFLLARRSCWAWRPVPHALRPAAQSWFLPCSLKAPACASMPVIFPSFSAHASLGICFSRRSPGNLVCWRRLRLACA